MSRCFLAARYLITYRIVPDVSPYGHPMPCSPHACPLDDRAAAAAAGAAEVSESRRPKSRRRKFAGLGFVLSTIALPLHLFTAPAAVDALLPVSSLPSTLRQRRTARSVADSPISLAKSGKLDRLDEGPGPSMGEGTDDDRDSMVTLSPPVLELITPNGCASSSDPAFLIRSVERAVAGGVSLVQLRDYDSDSKSKAELARRLLSAIGGQAMFVLNGEPDAARACGAGGVHLPERMMSSLVGLRGAGRWPRVVGCSVHSVAAAVEAARLGADYVQVGTMFPTQSHPGKEPEGVGMLSDVQRQLKAEGFGDVLVIGVGGIDASNCGRVAAAGGDGVAAISCLCVGDDTEGEARRIMGTLRENLLR